MKTINSLLAIVICTILSSNLLAQIGSIANQDHFKINYTFFMNIAFHIISGVLVYIGFFKGKDVKHFKVLAPKSKVLESTLKYTALASYLWVIGGTFIKFFII